MEVVIYYLFSFLPSNINLSLMQAASKCDDDEEEEEEEESKLAVMRSWFSLRLQFVYCINL